MLPPIVVSHRSLQQAAAPTHPTMYTQAKHHSTSCIANTQLVAWWPKGCACLPGTAALSKPEYACMPLAVPPLTPPRKEQLRPPRKCFLSAMVWRLHKHDCLIRRCRRRPGSGSPWACPPGRSCLPGPRGTRSWPPPGPSVSIPITQHYQHPLQMPKSRPKLPTIEQAPRVLGQHPAGAAVLPSLLFP